MEDAYSRTYRVGIIGEILIRLPCPSCPSDCNGNTLPRQIAEPDHLSQFRSRRLLWHLAIADLLMQILKLDR